MTDLWWGSKEQLHGPDLMHKQLGPKCSRSSVRSLNNLGPNAEQQSIARCESNCISCPVGTTVYYIASPQ